MDFGDIAENIVSREDKYLFKILRAASEKSITKRWYKPGSPAQDG